MADDVARVAHDLANALTRVRGFTELAERRLGPDHPAREELAEVARAAEAAIALVARLHGPGDG